MGSAIIKGIIKSKLVIPSNITASDVNREKLDSLHKNLI